MCASWQGEVVIIIDRVMKVLLPPDVEALLSPPAGDLRVGLTSNTGLVNIRKLKQSTIL